MRTGTASPSSTDRRRAGDPITIDGRCTACGLCLATCPERALIAAPGRPRLLGPLCTSCLACIEVCPVDAITETVASGLVANVALREHP